MHFLYYLALVCAASTHSVTLLPFHQTHRLDEQPEFCAIKPKNVFIDLNEVTEVILALIQGNSIEMMLENSDHTTVDLLLKNMSPAEIAFNAEVVNAEQPVVVVFYNDRTPCLSELKNTLTHYVANATCNLQCVMINADHLFKIAHINSITEIPTIILMNAGNELGRFEECGDAEELRAWLIKMLN